MSHGMLSSSLLLVWVLCAGCYTQPMWDDATCKTLSRPVVCGSLPTSPKEGRAPQWLIRYSTRPASRLMFALHILPDREFYFLLVTDGNGVPGSPFRYDTPERQWSTIEAAIPDEQRRAVEAQRLAPIAREDAQKLMARRDFVSASAMRLEEMGQPHFAPRSSAICAYVPIASAGASGSVLSPASGETREQRWHATTNPTLAPGAVIVLLPSQQPRPSGSRRGAMAVATVLTPATAVVDVVTIVVVGVGLGVMTIANVF